MSARKVEETAINNAHELVGKESKATGISNKFQYDYDEDPDITDTVSSEMVKLEVVDSKSSPVAPTQSVDGDKTKLQQQNQVIVIIMKCY